MSEQTLELTHDDIDYTVTVDLEWTYVDDSFDGHLGGRVHTFKSGHWEVEDFEVIDCIQHIGEDDNEVEPCDIKGLMEYICSYVSELTKDEYN